MHPNEIKNRALLAAAFAEMDGFSATAKALRQFADACSVEAGSVTALFLSPMQIDKKDTAMASIGQLQVAH